MSSSSPVAKVGAALSSAGSATASFLTQPSVKSWLYYGGLPILAFIAVSPGMLLSIPPTPDCNGKSKFWASGQTSVAAVILHAVVFFGLLVAIFKAGKALRVPLPF